jgi:hypothetical protein
LHVKSFSWPSEKHQPSKSLKIWIASRNPRNLKIDAHKIMLKTLTFWNKRFNHKAQTIIQVSKVSKINSHTMPFAFWVWWFCSHSYWAFFSFHSTMIQSPVHLTQHAHYSSVAKRASLSTRREKSVWEYHKSKCRQGVTSATFFYS